MAISTFPAPEGGATNNDFVVDMNETTNNSIDLPREFGSGSYAISLSSGDTTYDVYFLDSDGATVGYSNSSSIVASAAFETVVILGVATDEVISFAFSGAVANANGEGDETGAGAYLVSITPSDLPELDDTANVVGGNFAADVEFYFESGTVSTAAKNIVRSDSTALVVTRPDALDPALDPWDVKVINPGVTPPTGSNSHILAGTVDAGAAPVWVTTSPLPAGTLLQAYSETLSATDADGSVSYTVTSGSLPTGLSLDSSTGIIAGTPTAVGNPFTVTAEDQGGNTNPREFEIPIVQATGGSISVVDGYTVHTFDASGDFTPLTTITDVEYIILAGGGGGRRFGGGGGGGGLLASIPTFASGSATTALSAVTVNAQTYAVTIGAGGGENASGTDSSLANIGTAIGGGYGASRNVNAASGGSGGGASDNNGNKNEGAGTTGQGFSGGPKGSGNIDGGAGGGGTGGVGIATNAGQTGGIGTSNFLDERGWGAGGGGGQNGGSASGGGSDGNDQTNYAGNGGTAGNSATANYGGGGGGSSNSPSGSGASGKVIVRYQ